MKLPILKPKEIIRKLQRRGFIIDHQTGSHIILIHPVLKRRVTVPYHNKDIKKKTMKNIIDQAGLTIEGLTHLLSLRGVPYSGRRSNPINIAIIMGLLRPRVSSIAMTMLFCHKCVSPK